MLRLIARRLAQMVLIMATVSLVLFAIFDSDQFKRQLAVSELGGFGVANLADADYQAWREVGSVIEQRRKLVESERKRLIEMQQTLTAEKAMLLLGAVLGVIKEHVQDRNTLHAISRGIEQLTTIDAG